MGLKSLRWLRDWTEFTEEYKAVLCYIDMSKKVANDKEENETALWENPYIYDIGIKRFLIEFLKQH